MHPLTGVEKLVHKNRYQRYAKLAITFLIGLFMIVMTGIAAMNAYLVREVTSQAIKKIYDRTFFLSLIAALIAALHGGLP